jgi:RNA 2',3'-cyclic 3'-phosphodiesterase
MSRMRTFIAVELDKAVRDRIVRLREMVSLTGPAVKWVEPENLHITLFFLGEVEDTAVPSVCREVNDLVERLSAFELSIERVGCFPNKHRPHIIWLGVGQGSDELCQIHESLEPRLLQLGCYRREERKYRPHVTLGRIRSGRDSEYVGKELTRFQDWQGGRTLVRELLVLRSELTPQGPSYSVMARGRMRQV